MAKQRRSSPLTGWSIVAVIVLMVAALVVSALSTRAAVKDASRAVLDGQALASEQAVRADLAELDDLPTSQDLAEILEQRRADGLRYVATVDGEGNIVASAGSPVGRLERPAPAFGDASRARGRRVTQVGGRTRIELRAPFRRLRGRMRGMAWSVVTELEPVQADELRAAASRTVGIGAIAAIALLVVAVVLVRREVQRNAIERERERERRLASVGELSAVLAHEIRNPLASLKGNAQLLVAMLPAGDKPQAKAQRVVDEAIRLETLTNDLLAFVRTGTIARTPVDPAALVREAAASVSAAIVVDATRAPARWPLDGERIREVVVNLFDNAVQAGPANAPVHATVAQVGARLVIEVADRGPGVPVDDRDKIFEPFFTSKTAGTGLGLAVTRRIIELHGGTIVVGDAPGGGAVFHVELPTG